MAGKAANLGKKWIKDHPAALAQLLGRLQELCGRGSCCSHTGYPEHLVQGLQSGRAIIYGTEDPGTQSRRRIYVDSLKVDCKVYKGWKLDPKPCQRSHRRQWHEHRRNSQ